MSTTISLGSRRYATFGSSSTPSGSTSPDRVRGELLDGLRIRVEHAGLDAAGPGCGGRAGVGRRLFVFGGPGGPQRSALLFVALVLRQFESVALDGLVERPSPPRPAQQTTIREDRSARRRPLISCRSGVERGDLDAPQILDGRRPPRDVAPQHARQLVNPFGQPRVLLVGRDEGRAMGGVNALPPLRLRLLLAHVPRLGRVDLELTLDLALNAAGAVVLPAPQLPITRDLAPYRSTTYGTPHIRRSTPPDARLARPAQPLGDPARPSARS